MQGQTFGHSGQGQGCTQGQGQTQGGSLGLISVPDAYALVSPGIHRSGALSPASFPFVRSLGLVSVLILSPEPPSRMLLAFLDDAGILYRHQSAVHHALGIPMATGVSSGSGLTSGSAIGPNAAPGGYSAFPGEALKAGLEWALSARPTLILDAGGIAETGTAIGILRRLQGWSLGAALAEYRAFAGQKAKYWHEAVIESYDLDLFRIGVSNNGAPEKTPLL